MVQDEGVWVLLRPSLEKLYRVNIIGNILAKEKIGNITNILIDDGTGHLTVRFFEDAPFLADLLVGNAVLIVGKPRMYRQEIYLAPEIVRTMPFLWLKVRKSELGENSAETEGGSFRQQEIMVEIVGEESTLPRQKLVQLIKELDQGTGAPLEELMEKSPWKETEQLLEELLEKGEIFQNLPGKVKVL